MAYPGRLVIAAGLLAVTCGVAIVSGQSGAAAGSPADRLFAAYAAGDYEIVARTLTQPRDFQALHLTDPHAVARWLGAWQPRKATFLVELATVTTSVAPAQTWSLLSAGQRYVTGRPNRPGASSAEDAYERLWHRTALGLLQRSSLASFEEQYLDALRARRPGPPHPSLADERLLLAYAIAAEQRCWNERPSLSRAGAAADDVTHASGSAMTIDVSKASIALERARHRTCLSDAAARFDAAAIREAQAEARVRGAWTRFQLGQLPEALRTIDAVDTGDDRELAYWASLFRGRIDDALGRYADAERAYRAALAASPNAQSAGTGLALTLFRMQRATEADAVAVAVRTASAHDPWWTYSGADQRFAAEWLALLRKALP
jgi:hypothetical protein